MEYSELIHDFTDGTLETLREPELFNVLASNEDLRTEFKHQLAMKSAIRTDAKAYTPAVHSTLQIFSSLGFVPPAPLAATTVGDSGAGAVGAVKSAGFFSKFGTAIITGTIAVISTGIIAYWLFNSEIGQLKNENKNLTTQLNIEKKQGEIPVVKSFAMDESKNKINEPEKVKIKYVYIQKAEDRSQKTEAIDNGKLIMDNEELSQNTQSEQTDNGKQITKNELTINNSQLFGSANLDNGFYSLNSLNEQIRMNRINPAIQFDDNYFANVREDIGLSVEIMNMENWFEIAPTISPKEYNKFNNTSVALFYKLFKDFQAGLEYRRETFFQRFEGLDDKGKLNRYEQQPNFESWGLVLRYANKDFNLWDIYPYIQLYGGGTKVGYIVRGGAGLKYSPFTNLSFILGIGSSSLFYNHNASPWQSNRYDLNYGISIGF